MQEIITVSIGLGLVISLILSESLGIAAGGMVVPGYMALYLDKPSVIIMTILVSYATYFIVYSISTVVIIYGRRRTVLMILTGFMIGWFMRSVGNIYYDPLSIDLDIVGYIIPGLIAIWMDRQGILETVTTLITSSIIVRLILIVIFGTEIIQ